MSVAVIGAGHWGKNLIRTLHSLGALGAIVETSLETQNKIKKEYPHIPVYSDLNDLNDKEIKATAIATPVETHFRISKNALDRGFDVFVEKPITLSVNEAKTLCSIAKSKSKILMVGHLLLYQPAIRWINNFIIEGGIGALTSLHQERLNLGKVRSTENVLWSFGVHDIAVMLNLIGATPTSIECIGQCVLQPKIEDDVHVHMQFPNNVRAHLHVSWLWPEKTRKLVIIGTKNILIYDEISQTVTLQKKSILENLSIRDEGSEVVFTNQESPLTLEMQHFLERIKDRQEPLTNGDNAVSVLEVLEKIETKLKEKRENG